MQNQIIDQLTTTSTKSYETMISLSEINSSAIQKLTDLQFDFISMSMESGIEQAKLLNNMKNVKDIFAAGSEFASEYNEKLMGITRQTVEIFTESGDEAENLIEKAVASQVVSSKQAPAKVAKKPAAKVATKKSAQSQG
ncbi:MAG: phasin family protein [Proteobacteria bacterium]|nr:phasin family protein [Pseudomonadota bacterium]